MLLAFCLVLSGCLLTPDYGVVKAEAEEVDLWNGETWTDSNEDGVYDVTIEDADQLKAFSALVSANPSVQCNATLTSHIDMTGVTDWTPIGTSSAPYWGTFDGQHYRIKNLVINSTARYQGLFGIVGIANERTDIINVILDASCSITSTDYYAGMIAYISSGAVDVYIQKCGNEADITSPRRTGGIVGHVNSSGTVKIQNCYNTGDITGTQNYTAASYGNGVAGIAGVAQYRDKVTYENCYNAGTISFTNDSKGVTGSIYTWGKDPNGGTTKVDGRPKAVNNCYGLNPSADELLTMPVTELTPEMLIDTTATGLLYALQNYSDTTVTIWAQPEGYDHPVFAGSIRDEDDAMVDGVTYPTLGEALEAVKDADVKTITLCDKVTVTDPTLLLMDGITLDLGGQTLDMGTGYLVAFDGTKIVDGSSAKSGLLKVADGKFILPKDNEQMPVWNGTGYKFASVTNRSQMTEMIYVSDDYISFIQRPEFGDDINLLVAGGQSDSKVCVGVRLAWTSGSEAAGNLTNHVQDCYYSDTFHNQVYTENMGFTFAVSGLTDFDNVTATPIVVSNLGVVYEAGGTDMNGVALPYTPVKVEYPYYPAVEGATNLLIAQGRNWDFETINETTTFPTSWGRSGTVTVVNDDSAYEGNSVCVSGTSNNVYQNNIELEPNTSYQLSVWTKTQTDQGADGQSLPGGGYLKLEFKDDSGVTMHPYNGHTERYSGHSEWFRYTYRFTTPGGCNYLGLMLRSCNTGSVYFDNAELTQIGATQALDVRTNEIFYYDEWGNATVTATATYTEDADKYVKFYLMDGTKILGESDPISLAGKVSEYQVQDGVATWNFDISLMTDYMKKYTVKAVLCDVNGNPVDSGHTDALLMTNTVEKEVYRSSLPTNMNVDGNGVHNNTFTVINPDGTVNDSFVPVIAYHASSNDRATYKQFGINVVQLNLSNTDPTTIISTLDKYYNSGFYSLIRLYFGNNPAGSDLNKERTKAVVEAVKDHKGVFGYIIMDEPDDQVCDEEAMKESYRIIRSIDDKHPVYTLIVGRNEGDFEWAEKYVDIMATDPYPGADTLYENANSKVVTYPYNIIAPGAEELSNEGIYKPLYSIVQAFSYKGLTPSFDQMRTQLYMSMFAGAKGYGFFAMDQTVTLDGATVNMEEHPMMAAAKEMAKEGGEKDILFDYFVRGKGQLFMENREKKDDGTISTMKNEWYWGDYLLSYEDIDCRYIIWKTTEKVDEVEKDILYAMIMDGDGGEDKDGESDTISITLANENESIGAFTATVIGALADGSTVSAFPGNGTLTYGLGAGQSVLIKIVPEN